MTVIRLSTEQRRALAMLATAGRDGATRPLLIADGFGVPMINACQPKACDPDAREGVRRREDDRGRQDSDYGDGPEGDRGMTCVICPVILLQVETWTTGEASCERRFRGFRRQLRQ